ncbi:hypothetical protein POM88_034677 [Heracleum sosnowskyi]|uniref:Uncharacterized protein n=1 Tax=Heracleum sosnowskyi TaxID=360622 RepID=A0AAD8HJQ5_9APIA|nr:hypothetical protein POM88_034677 [Heracleum sosnowskyi]
MSLRNRPTLLQSTVKEETTNLRRSSRSTRVRWSLVTNALFEFEGESEEEIPRKNHTRRCNKKRKFLAAKQKQHSPEPPLNSAGHEMPPGETRDGVPEVELPSLLEQEKLMGNEMPLGETRAAGSIVEIPSSPQEEKPKFDLLFLLGKARKPHSQKDDSLKLREHLLNAASVLKFKLVTRLKSSADSLRTKDMIILANRCFNALIELEDDYTSFHSEVKKLIAQHQEVEFAAKDKESWNDIKARYMQQVQSLSSVGEKLSSAQDKLTTAKAKVDALKLKKLELLRILTDELYDEEERVKTLTAERNQFQKCYYDIKVGIGKLDAKKAEASVALKAIVLSVTSSCLYWSFHWDQANGSVIGVSSPAIRKLLHCVHSHLMGIRPQGGQKSLCLVYLVASTVTRRCTIMSLMILPSVNWSTVGDVFQRPRYETDSGWSMLSSGTFVVGAVS